MMGEMMDEIMVECLEAYGLGSWLGPPPCTHAICPPCPFYSSCGDCVCGYLGRASSPRSPGRPSRRPGWASSCRSDRSPSWWCRSARGSSPAAAKQTVGRVRGQLSCGEKMMIFVLKTGNCVSKTRDCVSKTRNFVFNVMNSAELLVRSRCRSRSRSRTCRECRA